MQINTRVGLNKNGVRGLLAKTAIKMGEKIIAIPDSAIIRSGRNTSCYIVRQSGCVLLCLLLDVPCLSLEGFLPLVFSPAKQTFFNLT